MTQKTFIKWLHIYGQAIKELSWLSWLYDDYSLKERTKTKEFWEARKRTARNKLLRGMLGES